MENMIPLNGRIAIVDDQIEQALPLMRVLSKNNIPYVYYRGNDMNYLPESPENDIRILFLDLNLLGGKDNQPKDIRSTLFSVISHIISPNNYPYVLILWSRQEKDYKEMLEGLFDNDLQNCAPIAIKNYIKSDFFPNFAENEENKENEHKLLEELKEIIVGLPAYSYLMQWENCIHNSADAIIQDIFHDFHSQENWKNNANCILEMFAQSYMGKHYKTSSSDNRAKASLMFLSDVYKDTLETIIAKTIISNANDLSHTVSESNRKDIVAKINAHLLLSNQYNSIRQSGCVLNFGNSTEYIDHFHEIFNNCFQKNELANKECNSLKKEIYKTLIPCEIIVTPICDYAQNKLKNDRIVQGIIIEEKFISYIDNRSEAIFMSPIFQYQDRTCIMVLNFRYFLTKEIDSSDIVPLFRLRNTMLAEIQSKLARHINRQGIMNL